jgi:hypothetical protein
MATMAMMNHPLLLVVMAVGLVTAHWPKLEVAMGMVRALASDDAKQPVESVSKPHGRSSGPS